MHAAGRALGASGIARSLRREQVFPVMAARYPLSVRAMRLGEGGRAAVIVQPGVNDFADDIAQVNLFSLLFEVPGELEQCVGRYPDGLYCSHSAFLPIERSFTRIRPRMLSLFERLAPAKFSWRGNEY